MSIGHTIAFWKREEEKKTSKEQQKIGTAETQEVIKAKGGGLKGSIITSGL